MRCPVGEVLAAIPLAQRLKSKYPERRLVISTTTLTGQKLARERMTFANAIFFFPLDWSGPVQRALAAARPAAVIIVETEIWPNFLRECRRASVPVAFVNGRLSERSFRGFKRALSYSAGMLSGFLKEVLGDATIFLMQSDDDAARLVAFGAPQDARASDRKFEIRSRRSCSRRSPLSAWLETELARGARRPVIVAGSVLANEEALVLQAYAQVEREFPQALFILAPRKPEEFDNAAEIIGKSGRKLLRRSELSLNGAGNSTLNKPGSILLLDSIGELAGEAHIVSRTPCLSADRSFPVAGTIFLSLPLSAKFRSTARRWKIFAKWLENFSPRMLSIQVADLRKRTRRRVVEVLVKR